MAGTPLDPPRSGSKLVTVRRPRFGQLSSRQLARSGFASGIYKASSEKALAIEDVAGFKWPGRRPGRRGRRMLTTLAQVSYGNSVLRPVGVLDARTYRQARDAIVKAALDRSTAVIVDVDGLHVPDDSSWAVFTSARWHVQDWPHVVIALASRDAA